MADTLMVSPLVGGTDLALYLIPLLRRSSRHHHPIALYRLFLFTIRLDFNTGGIVRTTVVPLTLTGLSVVFLTVTVYHLSERSPHSSDWL